jgi:dipeptidyl aminopeptidase/acylaminoacyl peptidase
MCSICLFGAEDTSPSPQDVVRIEEELKRFNKTYEFHTYENAGHAFFQLTGRATGYMLLWIAGRRNWHGLKNI